MNSQPSSASTRATVLVGGGAPATMIRTLSRPGISPSQVSAASSTEATTAGAAHITVTPYFSTRRRISAPSILRITTCFDAQAGHRERHPPAVGVEHRQRVQVDVAVGHAGVQREGDRVGPDVAVGDLHALGPGGGAGGVVDRRGGVLLVLPGLRAPCPRAANRYMSSSSPMTNLCSHSTPFMRVLELGVDVEDAGAGVLDDVLHLVGREPEVDRHQHPAVAGDAEERGVEPGAVVRDVGDPLAEPDAELVELRRLGPRELAHPRVGQVAERLRRAGRARRRCRCGRRTRPARGRGSRRQRTARSRVWLPSRSVPPP